MRPLRAAVGRGVKTYPDVMTEMETLSLVATGTSLARFGDGELRQAAHVVNIKPQIADAALTRRLRSILRDSGDCLVGIPNILARGPKDAHWRTYERYASLLSERRYGSAFITRPDSAPWINVESYWQLLHSLWVGRDITLVRGAQKSLTRDDLIRWGAGEVREILCPPQNAWAQYNTILSEIGTPKHSVLICLGPTATVLAVDLCAKGVHAIDLGHVGMFAKKRERGLPMWVTKDDKAVA